MALTALWCVCALGWAPLWLQATGATLRDAGWIVLLVVLIRSGASHHKLWRRLAAAAAVVIATDLVFNLFSLDLATGLGLRLNSAATRMAVCALGLMLVENLLRNSGRDQLWGFKLLGISLGLSFGFNLFLEIPPLFGNNQEGSMALAQPLIYLAVLPLFVVAAIRLPTMALKVHSSRRVVFHSAALAATGVLLESSALAAFYVRNYGGTIGTVLSLVLVFSCLAAAMTAAASATFRSRVQRFINENFFSYKYDYRAEWARFIRSLSARDEDSVSIQVLRTLADLLDCPGGLLFVWRENWGRYMPGAQYSVEADPAPIEPQDPMLAPFHEERAGFLEIGAANTDPAAMLWRGHYGFGWLVVPLRYRSRLVGVAVLTAPRAWRRLDWEDCNLISLAAAQLAIYLVHDDTARALADARLMEEFNRRTAFIVHDMKNAIGQLSLVAQNAGRFGEDPRFRQDMVVSIRRSVDQLQELLARLRGKPAPAPQAASMDLRRWLAEFVEEKKALGLPVALRAGSGDSAETEIDQGALRNVLNHVVDNALEAAPGSEVEIGLDKQGAAHRISVQDKGKGMAPTYLSDELFRPLRSAKGGFGIGAFQARQTMRELDGDLQVLSKVGDGTTVQLTLPQRDTGP